MVQPFHNFIRNIHLQVEKYLKLLELHKIKVFNYFIKNSKSSIRIGFKCISNFIFFDTLFSHPQILQNFTKIGSEKQQFSESFHLKKVRDLFVLSVSKYILLLWSWDFCLVFFSPHSLQLLTHVKKYRDE